MLRARAASTRAGAPGWRRRGRLCGGLIAALIGWWPAVASAEPDPLTLQAALKLPSWMNLQVAFSAEPLFNPVGGLEQTGAWVQQTSIDLELSRGLSRDTSQWKELDHWAVNLSVNHTAGDNTYNSSVGALFPLQNVAYPPGFWLTEATLERQAGNGWLNAKAGILALNPDFIQVPILNLYVHASLNNTLNITNNDLPVNPYSALGGVVNIKPSQDLSLRFGLYDLSSTLPLAQWLGVQPNLSAAGQGTTQIVQIDYTGSGLAPRADQQLQACAQTWALVRNFPRCEQPTTVKNQLPGGLISVGAFNSTDSNSGDGVYGSVTLRSGLPLGLDERVWIGASYSPNRDQDFAPTFVAGGLVVQGPFPKRPLDLLVVGIGRAGLSSDADPFPTSSYEGMAELGYRVRLSETLQLQPTLQWIFNPSAPNDSGQPTPGILAAGLRIDLNF